MQTFNKFSADRLFPNATNIRIPESYELISPNSFNQNSKAKTISLSPNTKIIGYCAFNSCNDLRTINISSELKIVMRKAFYNCNSLSQITMYSLTPKVVRNNWILLKNGLDNIDLIKIDKLFANQHTEFMSISLRAHITGCVQSEIYSRSLRLLENKHNETKKADILLSEVYGVIIGVYDLNLNQAINDSPLMYKVLPSITGHSQNINFWHR